jgi:hypothetical protein
MGKHRRHEQFRALFQAISTPPTTLHDALYTVNADAPAAAADIASNESKSVAGSWQ